VLAVLVLFTTGGIPMNVIDDKTFEELLGYLQEHQTFARNRQFLADNVQEVCVALRELKELVDRVPTDTRKCRKET
jgi:hypothetical protein